jgi:hypothetical protein
MGDDAKKDRKPRKGNPVWPSGQTSLSAIERKQRKANGADQSPGGVNQWKPWTLNSAARQGQAEMFPQEFPPAEPTVLHKHKDNWGREVFVERKPPPKRRRRRMGVFVP